MSTQDAAEIVFSSAHEQKAFKLLELPTELLELLESENPPVLYLKSSAEGSPAPGVALLSTPNKTYRIQQKNSSNPIMILEPSTTNAGSSQAGEEMFFVPQTSICTIAKIADTLELLPELEEKKVEKKVNKWHEKFAKSRNTGSSDG